MPITDAANTKVETAAAFEQAAPSSVVAAPAPTDIPGIVAASITGAVSAAATGGSSQGTKDAIDALTPALTALAEGAAGAANPILGAAVDVLAPTIIPEALQALANEVSLVWTMLKGEESSGIAALKAKLAAL